MKLTYDDSGGLPFYYKPKRHYGFFHFCWDVFMTIITCGLWLIWIFVREMRNR